MFQEGGVMRRVPYGDRGENPIGSTMRGDTWRIIEVGQVRRAGISCRKNSECQGPEAGMGRVHLKP